MIKTRRSEERSRLFPAHRCEFPGGCRRPGEWSLDVPAVNPHAPPDDRSYCEVHVVQLEWVQRVLAEQVESGRLRIVGQRDGQPVYIACDE